MPRETRGRSEGTSGKGGWDRQPALPPGTGAGSSRQKRRARWLVPSAWVLPWVQLLPGKVLSMGFYLACSLFGFFIFQTSSPHGINESAHFATR